jgi:hypothetical protein
MSDLPQGWAVARIGDLIASDGVFVDGDWVESKDQDPDGDVRLTQLADVGEGAFRNRSDRFLTSERRLRSAARFLLRATSSSRGCLIRLGGRAFSLGINGRASLPSTSALSDPARVASKLAG